MPSPLTLADVERIARLAHLELTDDEKALFRRQLADVLAYAERLQAVDTTGLPDAGQDEPASSVLRTDQPRQSLSCRAALSNAPAPGPHGLFRVPRVLK